MAFHQSRCVNFKGYKMQLPVYLQTPRKKFDNINPVLRSFHWLPIHQRIKFKILTIVFKMRNDLAPRHLCDLILVVKTT